MAHIFRAGDVSVHIQPGFEAEAICYDLRDEEFKTLVVIDLVAFLPLNYGESQEDYQLPRWQFVAAAMTACAGRGDELWQAWRSLRDEPFV